MMKFTRAPHICQIVFDKINILILFDVSFKTWVTKQFAPRQGEDFFGKEMPSKSKRRRVTWSPFKPRVIYR